MLIFKDKKKKIWEQICIGIKLYCISKWQKHIWPGVYLSIIREMKIGSNWDTTYISTKITSVKKTNMCEDIGQQECKLL